MLDWSRQYFAENQIEDPQLDAQVLLGHVLGMNKVDLIINGMRPLDEQELADYKKLVIKRVKERLPIAYILGVKDFWSLKLEVNDHVLIPRPDTECLVEQVLAFAKYKLENKPFPWNETESVSYDDVDDRQVYYEEVSAAENLEQKTEEWLDKQTNQYEDLTSQKAVDDFQSFLAESDTHEKTSDIDESKVSGLHIVDVGTGSGAIILALAKELGEKCHYTAVDISPEALDVARNNADQLNLKVDFIESDLLQKVTEPVDIIVSNPPYISTYEMQSLSAEVKHEPVLALEAGADGLDIYRRLIPQAAKRLVPGGALFVEIGFKQSEYVEEIFKSAGFTKVRTFKDYGRRPRVVFGIIE